MSFGDQKPEIKYPCDWTYKVIGEDEIKIRDAIYHLLGSTGHISKVSSSSKGKYTSISLVVPLQNETQRNDIYQKLAASPDIKMVF